MVVIVVAVANGVIFCQQGQMPAEAVVEGLGCAISSDQAISISEDLIA